MVIAIGTSDTLFMIIPVFIQSVTAVFKLTDIDIKEAITHSRDQRTVVCTGFRHRQSVTLIQQVCCLNENIAVRGLNGPRAIDDFLICRPLFVLLHPQAVARKNIAVKVMYSVSKQLQVISRVNQRGIEQGACGTHRQTARCAGKATDGDIAARSQFYIAARLKRAGGVQQNVLRTEGAAAAAHGERFIVGERTASTEDNGITLYYAVVGDGVL